MDNDLISRQEAIEALERIFDQCEEIEAHLPDGDPDKTGYKMFPDYMTVCKYLRQLPSARPETAKRIVGKSRGGMTLWYQCDMCNEPVDAQDNYCRGCGRRLIDG